jgi:hypothetical protein
MKIDLNVDPSFADCFGFAKHDEHLMNEEGEPDAFLKTLSDLGAGIDSEGLDASLAPMHEAIDSHYRKLAATVTAPAADDELQNIARRLAPRIQDAVRIEEELSADGSRIRKTYNAKTGDLVRVQILEEGDE